MSAANDSAKDVCPECHGSGELHIDSQNINENFEVEKQTIITECPCCKGSGAMSGGLQPGAGGNDG